MNWYKIANYEDYRERVQSLASQNPYPFKDWFDENGRVYVPFNVGGDQEGVDKWVQKALEDNGYIITDYRKGYCAKDNRTYRIGKVLNQIKANDIKKTQEAYERGELYNLERELKKVTDFMDETINMFLNSSFRTQKNATEFFVVISQNPHDLAQMSTGRNWTSCMSLGGYGEDVGLHHEDVFCEVAGGGLVAYLIYPNDMEIENPIARIHIRRFDNRDGSSVAIPEKSVYGQDVNGFQNFVEQWLNNQQAMTPGVYKRQGGEYSDTFDRTTTVPPTTPEDIQQWFSGEAQDSVYYEYAVNDELYEEYKDYMAEIGQEFTEWDPPSIENYSDKFKTLEEAEEYMAKTKEWGDSWDQWDREIMADYDFNSWSNEDENGNYTRPRFKIKTKKFDNTYEMRMNAIRSILKAPKGSYSTEILTEMKDDLLSRNHYLIKDFFKKYPELMTEEDIKQLKDTDNIEFIKNLPPEKQEPYKKEWANYVSGVLDSPDNLINRDLEDKYLPTLKGYEKEAESNPKLMDDPGYQSKWKLMADKACQDLRTNYGSYVSYPLRELFSPIPEDIIQKIVSYPNRIMDTFFSHPFYDQDDINKDMFIRFAIENIGTFSRTKSDTPTVQRYYESLLPYWSDNIEARYKSNQIGVHELGYAIGQLGENGRQFIPFIQEKTNKVKEHYKEIEQEKGELSPGSFQWQQKETLLKQLDKNIERHLYILDLLERGDTQSKKYRWAKNWYKKIVYGL